MENVYLGITVCSEFLTVHMRSTPAWPKGLQDLTWDDWGMGPVCCHAQSSLLI